MNKPNRDLLYWDPGLTGVLPRQGFGSEFWSLARAFVAAVDASPQTDSLLKPGLASKPRVWLLVHRSGGEETGALAGVVLAGLLARSGRRTLLVDADEDEMILTRRADRVFKPGWVDMVRYGSSLTAAGLEVVWEGTAGYFLGEGSYRPAEMEPGEIAAWRPRLAGHVDDVVAVCGRATAPSWAEAAQDIWIAWDRRRDPREVPLALADDLAGQGLSCHGVMVCGPAPEAPALAGKDIAAVLDSLTPATEDGLQPEPVPSGPAAPPTAPSDPEDGPRHSSGIFRVAALTVLVMVVMLVAVIWKFTDLGRLGSPAGADHGSTVVSVPVPDRPADLPTAGRDSSVLDTNPIPAGMGQDSIPVASRDTLAVAGVDSQTLQPAVAEPDTTAPEDGPQARWERIADHFTGTVGQDGWCLHVYSLRDSIAARREIAMVERRGVRATAAAVTRPDSSVWYRVFVGSFTSRAAAREALPALKWKLRTDWAAPRVLPAGAWDQRPAPSGSATQDASAEG